MYDLFKFNLTVIVMKPSCSVMFCNVVLLSLCDLLQCILTKNSNVLVNIVGLCQCMSNCKRGRNNSVKLQLG